MSFQTISPQSPSKPLTKELVRARRKARERVDITARDCRVSWEEVRLISLELVGKRDGLNLSECRKVIEEIKRRVR